MCRFLGSLLLALLCFVQPSSAQMTMMGVSGNQPSGGASPTWTAGSGSAQSTTFGSTWTANNIINNGTNIPSGAYACFAFYTRQGTGSIGPLTFTIGGNAASTVVTDTGTSTYGSALVCASMPSPATDQITIAGTNNFGVEAVAGGFFQNLSSTTPVATGCTTFSNQNSNTLITLQTSCTGANTTITNNSGGIGLAAVSYRTGTTGSSCGTITWSTTGSSNMTSSSSDATGCLVTNPDAIGIGHTTTSGSWGPSASSSPTFANNSGMVAATFR